MDQAVKDKLIEVINRGLCSGEGCDPEGQVCIEQAISIAIGEPFTSASPSCVHPVVRAHSIALNDCSYWSSPKVKADSLRKYALNQLGCTQIDGSEFVKRLALANIQKILPIALRATAALAFFAGEHREKLIAAAELCEQTKDLDTARTAAYTAADTARTAARTAAADTAADTVLALHAKIASDILSELLKEASEK